MSTAAPAVPLSTRHRTLIMGCTMIATMMQALDNTIANVALPHMQGSLGTNRDQITWVLTSYVIAAAIMTAPVGWFAARFGRKEFFLVSLIGFTITSILPPPSAMPRTISSACSPATSACRPRPMPGPSVPVAPKPISTRTSP